MKVLIVMTTNFGISGITKMVLNYYKNMDKNDMQIDFVVPNIPSEELQKILNKNKSRFTVLENRNKKPINYMRKLVKVIENGKYDIVHAHGNSATLFFEMHAAKKAHCKIRIAHSHNTTCQHMILNKILMIPFLKDCNGRFACGEEAGKWLFKNKSFYIMPNGIELEKFKFNPIVRENIRKKYNIKDDEILIGHVGCFNYQKNHDFLIDVFKKYLNQNENAKLVLIGSGDTKKQIEDKCKELEIIDKVIFTGEINNVPEWLSACDIMLLPSRYEGFPVVLIEWQASNLPCIISDTITKDVKLTDLVEYESISENDSIDKWVDKINKIKRSKNRKIESDKKIKILTNEGYSIKENAEIMKKIYSNLLKNDKECK